MVLRILLIVALLGSVSANATLKEWWKGFCERNLIAEDPYDGEEEITELITSLPHHEYVAALIDKYKRVGVYILYHKDASRVRLRNFGKELRRLNAEHPNHDIENVLYNYSQFEE